jgi:Allene oxide cyclase
MQALFSGIGCCCGDQRTNKTFDARIPPSFQLAFWFQSTLFHGHFGHCREANLFTSFKGDETMKKSLVFTAVASLLVGVLAGAFFTLHTSNPTAKANGQRVIHVVEHAITDTVQQFHPPKDSIGDILGFHNPVFDAKDNHQVGTDNGQCTRTVATGKTEWECFWTTFLAHGQITVEGPFFDDGTDTTLTITGGTGIYVEAHGSMLLHARGNPVGSEFDFIFMLAE